MPSSSLDDAIATALGRQERRDPVTRPTGGPAGNARLAAVLGLALLVGFAVQGLTLLDLTGVLRWHLVADGRTWHIAVGALLVPVALAKTGTTGWRIVRYYRGERTYVHAGPPPLLLRVVGPLVAITTLALLGSGLTLIALGDDAAHRSIVAGISAMTIHQVLFFVWLAPMTAHVLGRTYPALRRAVGPRLPGRRRRRAFLVSTAVVAAVASVLTVGGAHSWTHPQRPAAHHATR